MIIAHCDVYTLLLLGTFCSNVSEIEVCHQIAKQLQVELLVVGYVLTEQ